MVKEVGVHLSGLFVQELENWLVERQIPAFRGRQVFHWIQKQASLDFKEMTNISRQVQEVLIAEWQKPLALELITTRISQDGTEKFLFGLDDGATIETVLLPEEKRQTICISTQVGCAMNCSFCATGQAGYLRNLTSGEIVSQVLWVENHLKKRDLSLTNVVYMGMGEPFANYDSVLKSAKLLNHPDGLNLGARRLTISTCGLAPQIKALAHEELQVNLAISLHAITDEERAKIMPVNNRFSLQVLLEACKYYTETTGRRVSYEYALIDQFNDSVEQAQGLSNLLAEQLCHVNLIPINPVAGKKRPSTKRIQAFAKVLEQAGIPVSIRKERGADIEAACGQLRQAQQNLEDELS